MLKWLKGLFKPETITLECIWCGTPVTMDLNAGLAQEAANIDNCCSDKCKEALREYKREQSHREKHEREPTGFYRSKQFQELRDRILRSASDAPLTLAQINEVIRKIEESQKQLAAYLQANNVSLAAIESISFPDRIALAALRECAERRSPSVMMSTITFFTALRDSEEQRGVCNAKLFQSMSIKELARELIIRSYDEDYGAFFPDDGGGGTSSFGRAVQREINWLQRSTPRKKMSIEKEMERRRKHYEQQ